MTDAFDYCFRQGDDGQQEISNREQIECIVSSLRISSAAKTIAEPSRIVLVLLSAACVVFMQAGFAMLSVGSVRKKNTQSTLLKNFVDACSSMVSFFVIGYAIAFGGSDPTSPHKTFLGGSNFFLQNVDDLSFWVFQCSFCAASVTIVAGALSERCRMVAYLLYSTLLSSFVYPIVAHAVWDYQGFLSAYSVQPLFGVGMIDNAGGAVVHVTGGAIALLAVCIIGPRRGR